MDTSAQPVLRIVALLAVLAVASGCEDEPAPSTVDSAVEVDGSGGDGPGVDSPAGDASLCGPGTTLCGGVCLSTNSDNKNCGACGNACKAGQVCAAGKCALACPSGQQKCGGGDVGAPYCAKLQTDYQNCGACGKTCSAGQVCSSGACTLSCPSGQQKCSGDAGAPYCATLTSDQQNCGACGTACQAGQICAAGICALSCPPGQFKCSGGDAGAAFCAKLSTDYQNCGACGNACKAGQICAAGVCALACPPGQQKCSGGDAGAPSCAKLQTDPQNCGTCGNACQAGEVCAAGACVLSCPPGQLKCSAGDAGAPTCADVKIDPNNCGACGNACGAGQICSSGACLLSCPTGQQKCAGGDAGAAFCTSTQLDPNNCGTCGNACQTGQVCSAGKCAVTCASGQTNCSGACANLQSDPKNCGKCGGACKQGQWCCSGACTNVQTDNKNCGACGNACGSAFPCLAGKCAKSTSCASILAANSAAKSGIYSILPPSASAPMDVYCDMTTAGGGWTLALNLDTSDGHVMWWGHALWTDKNSYGSAKTALTADHKSKAWTELSGATQLMLVVHQQGTYKGWKVFLKPDTKTMFQYLQSGDNTIIGSQVLGSDTSAVWSNERLVRLSKKLYANRCIQNGGNCTSGSTGSPDGDRIGSVVATPLNNTGGGLGNWHDMNYCCKGKKYGSGKICNGSAFRTVSEAQAGWGRNAGTFGVDSLATMSNAQTDSPCGNAAWAKANGIAYDYAIFLRVPPLPTSCAEKMLMGASKDGPYTIDPNGGSQTDAFSAYCDMSTNGGGWTIVYGATGADGEQPLVSNTDVAGDPLTFKHHNLNRAKKMALSAISSQSLFMRQDSSWLRVNRALFDGKLDTKNSHSHFAVTLTASNNLSASGWMGYSNYNIAHGGDFNLSTSKVANGVDHHSSSYYHLNGSCVYHYLYSYSYTKGDGDAGYDVNTALGSWTATQSCDAAEGGKLVFYAAVR